MAKSTDYYGSYTDEDSGVGIEFDNSSLNDLNSSRVTMIEPSHSNVVYSRMPSLLPLPSTTMKQRIDVAPLTHFASDGVIERVRPATMKNHENGDFIVCQTNRGAYVAYRTPVVPQWIQRLVEEIEFQQQ